MQCRGIQGVPKIESLTTLFGGIIRLPRSFMQAAKSTMHNELQWGSKTTDRPQHMGALEVDTTMRATGALQAHFLCACSLPTTCCEPSAWVATSWTCEVGHTEPSLLSCLGAVCVPFCVRAGRVITSSADRLELEEDP